MKGGHGGTYLSKPPSPGSIAADIPAARDALSHESIPTEQKPGFLFSLHLGSDSLAEIFSALQR